MEDAKPLLKEKNKKVETQKIKKPTRVIDTGSKTMVGGNVKTTVDVDALPREVKEKAQKVAKTNETIKKAVIKRRDEGMLSPTMPKRANQLSSDFGLGAMDGAKKGKMIKAMGGTMVTRGQGQVMRTKKTKII